MDPIVTLEQVSREYEFGERTVTALSGFDYQFERGVVLVIAGPSGSGKSTLLNLIGCIDKPTAGRVLLDGQDVTDQSLEELADLRRENIGFIFQSFNLVPVLTAYENVELPLLFGNLSPTEIRNRSVEMLERVGLADRIHHLPGQLSGGQRQRVAIARALAGQPKIVVADEPTASLDSVTAQEIVDLLTELNADYHCTVFVATHDQKLIGKADRILTLQDGRIV